MGGAKNQVTLTFAGDEKSLTKSMGNVGSAAKSMSEDVGRASKKVEDAGSGFDRVGEGFDTTETRAMGLKDTLDGVGGSMQGLSEIAKGNTYEGLLLLGQGVADTASGFANALIPGMKAGVTWLRNTTVAQRALNIAMKLNPMGLIITGLTLLVAGFILAYKKSETFRNIVNGALRGVQKAFSWLVDGFGKAWSVLSSAWARFASWVGGWKSAVSARISSLFQPYVTAFGAAWSAVSGAWNRFTGWVSGWKASISSRVSSIFSGVVSAFGSAWTTLSGAWSRFWNWVGGWKKALNFSGMFDGIMGAAKSAFNWLIGKWNGLEFSMPSVDTHIPGVGTIGGWSIGTPNIPYFHTGGTVPGAPGTEVLAMLQAGERVTPAGRSDRTVIELRSSGSRIDDMLLELLRNAIAVRGGDVQVVLGRS